MCKIFLSINKKGELNNKTINQLLNANINDLSMEGDGYSVYRENRTYFYDGEKAYTNILNNLEYRNEEIFIIHTRTKTAGSSGIDGLHLQDIGGWVFAHNGTVNKFAGVLKKSDSFYFFKHLLKRYKNLNAENVNKYTQEAGFSGKGVLYNPKEKTLIWFCNTPTQVYILDDAIILTTFKLTTSYTFYDYKTVLGYTWKVAEKRVEIGGIIHHEEIDNIFLKFEDGILKETGKIENRSYYYWGNGNNWGNNNYYNYNYYADNEELYLEQYNKKEKNKNKKSNGLRKLIELS
jgi:predicted glutamine amidotransferase